MSNKRPNYFMSVAELTANLSHARLLKVGAVAVRDRRIICTGYNGTPEGSDNECEVEINGLLKTKDNVEHAERNLVYYAAKYGIRLKGAELYVTHAPCPDCARSLLLAGVSKVMWRYHHKNLDGIAILNDCKILNYCV